MKGIAVEMGVFGKKVLVEEKSMRTHHHPPLLKPILESHNVSSMVVVSHYLHSRRARAIFCRYYGEKISMYFGKARSGFALTAQPRYISATTTLIWNIGTHMLAKMKSWA